MSQSWLMPGVNDDLILREDFVEKWTEKFLDFERRISSNECQWGCHTRKAYSDGGLCFIHSKEYERLCAKFKKEQLQNVKLYGNTCCGHFFRNEIELILHNLRCPALIEITKDNRSCKPRCEFFFAMRTKYLQTFDCYVGKWCCIKCTYFLNYRLRGLV